MWAGVYICMCTCDCVLCCVCVRVPMCICVYVYSCLYMYSYVYACVWMCIHTYMEVVGWENDSQYFQRKLIGIVLNNNTSYFKIVGFRDICCFLLETFLYSLNKQVSLLKEKRKCLLFKIIFLKRITPLVLTMGRYLDHTVKSKKEIQSNVYNIILFLGKKNFG